MTLETKIELPFKKQSKIQKTIKPIIERNEIDKKETIIVQFVKLCHKEQISENNVKEIINKELTNEIDREFYFGVVEDIYQLSACIYDDYNEIDESTLYTKEEIKQLKNLVIGKEVTLIREETSTEQAVVINFKKQQILREQTNIKNKRNLSKYYTVIEAIPDKVIVYDTLLVDEPRSFEIFWKTPFSKKITRTGGEIGGGGITEIESLLEDIGLCPNPRLLKGTISTVINTYIKHNLAIIKDKVEYPGFFYDEEKDKLINIKYDIEEPTKEELLEAVKVIDDLKPFYKDELEKIATSLKWGWLSPFNYIKKGFGEWMPYLFLEGAGGTGKTTNAEIIIYLWDTPADGINKYGGATAFATVPQIGSRVSQSTFPINVNEPGTIFIEKKTGDALKTVCESTVGRGKYQGRRYTNFPALAPVIFTANRFSYPDDGGRRILRVNFSLKSRKTDEEKEAFKQAFKMNLKKQCAFHKLKAISQFFANEIKHNPKILKEDWEVVANNILELLYVDLDLKMPDWLKLFVENQNLEDYDDEQKEDLRIFLSDEINRKMNKVEVWDEEGFKKRKESLTSNTVKGVDDFHNRIWYVLNERLIPYMVPLQSKGKDYVCLTKYLKKELNRETDVCLDLKSIAELLGWKYQSVRLSKGANPQMVIKVSFEKFADFIFPTAEIDEEEEV
nr:hypothetical protein [Methanobrevibacter arboriphilus]